MLTSVIYKKISDFLISKWKKDLFWYIISIKLLQNKIIIKTQKPIVNQELQYHSSDIEDLVKDTLNAFGYRLDKVKVIFR